MRLLLLRVLLFVLVCTSPGLAQFLHFKSIIKNDVNGVTNMSQPTVVKLSPDGKQLYTLGNMTSAVIVFNRNEVTGALTQTQTIVNNTNGITQMVQPGDLTISPDGKNVYVTSYYANSILSFSRNTTTGLLTYMSTLTNGVDVIDGLSDITSPIVSADGKSVYCVSYSGSFITVLIRNQTTGALSYFQTLKDGVSGVDGIAGASQCAISHDGNIVYVSGPEDKAVAIFGRNQTTGALTYLQHFQSAGNLELAGALLISADDKNLYVGSSDNNAVLSFSRNPSNGALTLLQTIIDNSIPYSSPYNTPDQFAITPDQKNVVLSAQGAESLVTFSRNTATGELTYSDAAINKLFGYSGWSRPKGLAFAPDGQFLYTASWVDETIVCFRLYPNNNAVSGNVFSDLNGNCVKDPGELPIPNVLIKTTPERFYAITDAQGNYTIKLDAEPYTVDYALNDFQTATIQGSVCPTSGYIFDFAGTSDYVTGYNFAMAIQDCSYLTVDIESTARRRCFRNTTYVTYANMGYADATNVKVEVIFPEYVEPISSVPAWSSRVDSLLTYTIPLVAAGQTGKIVIRDSVSCADENIRGLTQCTQAIISPKSECTPEPAGWDKSSIKVTGRCKSTNVYFYITNEGTGDMDSPRTYRIYKNDELVYQANFYLTAGQELRVQVPVDGETVRLEADQHPLHPGISKPRASIEACGNTMIASMKGIVIKTPKDDQGENVEISCSIITDSYDPNDKAVDPPGIYSGNYVSETGEQEYTIRFQNTGTATAYKIYITDTISASLDMASFKPGASSHPYTMTMKGLDQTAVTFYFHNINLPSKNFNEVGSHGFVKYKIKPKSTTPERTVVTNKAYIYFDYNSPIITNTTSVTLFDTTFADFTRGQDIMEVTSIMKSEEATLFTVMPNPSNGNFKVAFAEPGSYSLVLLNNLGLELQRLEGNGEEKEMNAASCKPGMYTLNVYKDQKRIGVKKVVIQ